MSMLDYPIKFDYVSKKKKRIKRELLNGDINFVEKKIAILNGSTSDEVKDMLEIFLLYQGIKPIFYTSEYNKYFEDAVFPSVDFLEFNPDIVYIHTTYRNIINLPTLTDPENYVDELLNLEVERFENIWSSLFKNFSCQIIQNNFDRPSYRLLGNADIYLPQGISNFISRLNQKFYSFAKDNKDFHINDIDYLSSEFGLEKWHDLSVWYMYKYAFSVKAIPRFSFNLSNIIKAIFGKNKKSLVLDLDNTLWGGVIGDDGIEEINLGEELPIDQAYKEFQKYIKAHKDLGIILNIASKNDHDNALLGLSHKQGCLKEDDFVSIKANWNNKDYNIIEIARELNLGTDSFVFIDDNPVERNLVSENVFGISVPEIKNPEEYIGIIDKAGFFETIGISSDDGKKTEMYKANFEREKLKSTFTDYKDYLKSLDMVAEIKSFDESSFSRVAQLCNKSNQFNLTTKRYTRSEIENMGNSSDYICVCGSLEDKYGDNGIVSVVIGQIKEDELHIVLWLMSCRVIKRDMEYAMLDMLVKKAKANGVENIFGYYYKTKKNNMVKDFYDKMGFELVEKLNENDTKWKMESLNYKDNNEVIKIKEEE